MPHALTIGLGGNVGDRLAYLHAAAELLARHPALHVIARSRIYESPALGPPQPAYLNAALRAETDLALDDVLDVLLVTERALGRVRGVRWGPRTIDLDLLYADGVAHHSSRLDVPHPGLADRPFALAPLLDVTPDTVLAARLAALGGPPDVVGALDTPLSGGLRGRVAALIG